jgi:hypothetical protein
MVALLLNAPNLMMIFTIITELELDRSQLYRISGFAVALGLGGFGLGWISGLAWLAVRPRKFGGGTPPGPVSGFPKPR